MKAAEQLWPLDTYGGHPVVESYRGGFVTSSDSLTGKAFEK